MHFLSKIALVCLSLCTLSFANNIDKSISVIEKTNIKLGTYQNKIDKIDDQTSDLLSKYKYTNLEIKSTKSYNKQLQDVIDSQNNELKDISTQLLEIEETQKNIVPLMKNMIKSLDTLVLLDTPFLLNERKTRILKLEKMISRADIKTHEKYRIILEAFKIEYDYAKNIETYQDTLDEITYEFLRIGRVGLYYQSLDFHTYGYWNKKLNKWQDIEDSTAKAEIRKGIKIAKKQKNVSFLELPFFNTKDMK